MKSNSKIKPLKIAILGFGREGQSVFRYLKKSSHFKKSKIEILDRKRSRNYLKNLNRFDLIFRSPGIPYNLPELKKARKEGVYFSGDLIIANLTAIYSEFDGDLEDYRITLDKLLEEPIQRMLPAHGDEIIAPKRSINLVKKTLDILERGIVRRLTESSPSDLLNLMEAAIGKKVHSGGHLSTALALVYAIIKRLEKKKKLRIECRDDGYEKFFLV